MDINQLIVMLLYLIVILSFWVFPYYFAQLHFLPELRMNFPSIQNFGELNDDWYFISIDQNVIRFDDDGDRLEFQKL